MSSVRMLWTSEERSVCCATDTSDHGHNNGGRLKNREIYPVLLVQRVAKQRRKTPKTRKSTLNCSLNVWPSSTVHSPERIRRYSASHNWLALTIQKYFNNLHVLVDDFPKREVSQASGVQDLVHEGLLLDTSWPTNQRFLGKPRVTLGDSIELSSIVLRAHLSRNNLTSRSKLLTDEFVRKRRVSSPLIVLCNILG